MRFTYRFGIPAGQVKGRLDAIWYGGHPFSLALAPMGMLVGLYSRFRRIGYRLGLLPQYSSPVPVIVIGNIAVGGTGKTPLTIALIQYLLGKGYRPGIVCRGYLGRARSWPQQVHADSDPVQVGDEPLLLAKRTGCPVAAAPRRVAAVKELLRVHQCDVIVCDDGLQHLALARDLEIAVIDGKRRHGNGRCLPAGPLREPVSRLKSVDFVVTNGEAQQGEFTMRLVPGLAYNLRNPEIRQELAAFRHQPIHAVCGIGHPQRFFRQLRALGLDLIEHALPDHHAFVPGDLQFGDELSVLMTEKDAVKCARFAEIQHWCIPVDAELSDEFFTAFDTRMARCRAEPGH